MITEMLCLGEKYDRENQNRVVAFGKATTFENESELSDARVAGFVHMRSVYLV